MTARLQHMLSYPLRWMRAERAALYLDISKSKFLELVDSGTLPGPARIDAIRLWDRAELDAAIEGHKGIPEEESAPADRPAPHSFDAVIEMSRRRPTK